jgi:hypothetical protein
MASQPSVRIGDAERDAAAAELREHYAAGRLTLAEFGQRLDAVFASRTRQDLSRVTADLPHVRPADVPLPSEQIPRAAGPHAGLTAGRGRRGEDEQRRGHHHRGGLAGLAALLAALATWVLVYQVILVGLKLPFGGRIGLLIAVFTVLRGILRRVLGIRRGGRSRGGRRR